MLSVNLLDEMLGELLSFFGDMATLWLALPFGFDFAFRTRSGFQGQIYCFELEDLLDEDFDPELDLDTLGETEFEVTLDF